MPSWGARAGVSILSTGALRAEFEVACPRCGKPLVYDDVIFAGMPILLESHCPACGGEFLLHWPAGHALLHPTIVEVSTGAIFFDGSAWYPQAVERTLDSRDHPLRGRLAVRGGERPRAASIVVVDCLDYVYGHCVLKALSALHYTREPNLDVIMIVQPQVAWLVPRGVYAVIEVDAKLSEGDRWIDELDATVKRLVDGYTTIRIAPTPSQPRLGAGDLALAAHGELAPVRFWETPPGAPPQVALLLREDRLWIGREPAWLERVRLPAGLRRRRDLRRQHRRYGQVVRQTQSVVPDVRFVAIGLGRPGGLPAAVHDLRTESISPDDELRWCAEYARSDVVVGIHGSHMLLPSALAGAVVNILPHGKLPNIGQDLIIAGEADREPKLCLFRYRILAEETRPATISETIVSILRDADRHHLNMVENPGAADRWRRPIVWRPMSGAP